jgi:hypothetical protein
MAGLLRLVVKPTEPLKLMTLRRMPPNLRKEAEKLAWGAVLFVQGQVADILAATDVATKAARVFASEVAGNCPQHINTVAFIGSVADVRQAKAAIEDWGWKP